MAYPAAPTFVSPERGSAWVMVDGRVAATQGSTFVRTLQNQLRQTLGASPAPNYANPIAGTEILADGIWGRATNRGLYAWAQRQGASVADLAAIRNVEATGAIDLRTLAWAAALALGASSIAAVQVDPRTIPPGWRVAPPADAVGDRRVITFSPTDVAQVANDVGITSPAHGPQPTPEPAPAPSPTPAPAAAAPSSSPYVAELAIGTLILGGLGWFFYARSTGAPRANPTDARDYAATERCYRTAGRR